MARRVILCLFSVLVYSNADKLDDQDMLRVGPPLFGERSTTERPLWELVPPFPAEAGHRLFAPRPEYLKSQIHFPKRDPGEDVYGNEENIGQGYEGPEPGTVMRIRGSRSKRSLKFYLGDPGFRTEMYPINNGYRRMPYDRRNVAYFQNNNLKQEPFKKTFNRLLELTNYLQDENHNKLNLEDENRGRFRLRRMQARNLYDKILNNIYNIYNSPIHVNHNYNVFELPKEAFRRRELYDEYSETKRKNIKKPVNIVIKYDDQDINDIGGSFRNINSKTKISDTEEDNEEGNVNTIMLNDYYEPKKFGKNSGINDENQDTNEEIKPYTSEIYKQKFKNINLSEWKDDIKKVNIDDTTKNFFTFKPFDFNYTNENDDAQIRYKKVYPDKPDVITKYKPTEDNALTKITDEAFTENKTLVDELFNNKTQGKELKHNKTFTKGSLRNKTLVEKEESPDNLYIRVLNDDEDHENKASGTLKRSLIEQSNEDANGRRKRSIIRRRFQHRRFHDNKKKKFFSDLLRRQNQQTATDPKDEIVKALSQLESGFVRSRKSKSKTAVINDPHLGPPGPYIPPPATTLGPCCTPPPPPPPPASPAYLNMTGDHMNIYPEAPEWGYPESDRIIPGVRPWWYYNQDDYQSLKPKIPDHVIRV